MASRAIKVDPKKSVTGDPATRVRPDDVEIAARAYELWQERGCPIGSSETDWFRAEEELRKQTRSIRTTA